MNLVYVIFQKEMDHGKPMPRFQVMTEPPNHTHKVFQLQPGECIDAAQVFLGEDQTYVRVECYCVSNIEGQPKTDLLESYTMSYVR
jgi:hypothetical protein